MVVDTASLLDKESRKALQLLQGIKRTQLVIPGMGKYKLDLLHLKELSLRANNAFNSTDCGIPTNKDKHVLLCILSH